MTNAEKFELEKEIHLLAKKAADMLVQVTDETVRNDKRKTIEFISEIVMNVYAESVVELISNRLYEKVKV